MSFYNVFKSLKIKGTLVTLQKPDTFGEDISTAGFLVQFQLIWKTKTNQALLFGVIQMQIWAWTQNKSSCLHMMPVKHVSNILNI